MDREEDKGKTERGGGGLGGQGTARVFPVNNCQLYQISCKWSCHSPAVWKGSIPGCLGYCSYISGGYPAYG